MHIEYLSEFIELAQCLNYTEAARRCNVAQSSLSKHIVLLEKAMGVTLINRDTHTVELTQAGHIFFQEALEITARFEKAKHRARKAGSLPTLRIGGLLQNPKVLWSVSSTLAALEQNDVNFSCSYHQVFSKPFFDLLLDQDIDLLFSYQEQGLQEEDVFEYRKIFNDKFIAIVTSNHPLAKKPSLSIEDLKEEKLIHLAGAYHSIGWERIKEVCLNHGFNALERAAFIQPGLDYSLVDPKDDVLILSQSSLTGQLFPRMESYACIPIVDEDAHFSIYAISKKSNTNIALRIFMDQLEAAYLEQK